MNDPLDLWTVETTDLTARVAAAIGTPPPPDAPLLAELRLLRRELAELRATTALLAEEVTRLRAAAPRRIVPFASAEGRALLS